MRTKAFLYLLMFNVQFLLFIACTGNPDQVKITGDFTNLGAS